MLLFNYDLAEELELDPFIFSSDYGLSIFSGNEIPEGSTPIAQAYAGHQFGNFNPHLGDGRALLLGEITNIHNQVKDIQLKGSGLTPFSRRGDGKSALGPVLREYLISESMNAMGIPTTRSLAAIASGENILRDTLLPGGVLTRIASSHIRIGTFEYASKLEDKNQIKKLADYSINRHYPEVAEIDNPYLAFFAAVCNEQASLIANWMAVGFIHGVMNTDNMTISGETIDYGPCGFMDEYHPLTVFSSIDIFIDDKGSVLTTIEAVQSCERITLDSAHDATVILSDEALGIAVLKPEERLAPLGVAMFQTGVPRLQAEVAVAGFPYGDVLVTPSLTFGRLADLRGLNGEENIKRLSLTAQDGDACGPVFDNGGAVLGMLLPKVSTNGQVLPPEVSFSVDTDLILASLAGAGITAQTTDTMAFMPPETLTLRAAENTVLVSCW